MPSSHSGFSSAPTWHRDDRVTVQEFGNGDPYLIFEQREGEEVPLLRNCTVGLTFEPGSPVLASSAAPLRARRPESEIARFDDPRAAPR